MSLRARLVLAAGTAAVLAVLLASIGSYVASRHSLVSSVDDALVTTAQQGLKSTIFDPSAITGLAVQVTDPAGDVLATSGVPNSSSLPVTAEVRAVASGHQGHLFADTQVGGTALREYVTPLPPFTRVNGFVLFRGGSLQLATPLTGVNSQLGNLGLALILVAIAAVAVAVVLGWFVARAAMRPLNSLTARLESLAQTTDVSERLDPGGADELGRLRRAFNRLLGALESSRESQRQLVLDAAHELRTPLTSLRTNLEVVRRIDELEPSDRALLVDDVLTQMEELRILVTDLAELARGDHHPGEAAPLRLDQITEDAVGLARTHARPRGVRFTVTSSPTWVRGNRDRIMRAVGNLLDNALKWSPDSAQIEVACSGGTITVRDHGPGIDPADLPHIFDRFYRAPSARALPGSGLGLAIVSQVAEAERGSVHSVNAQGGGSLFTLRLPEIAPPVGNGAAPPTRAVLGGNHPVPSPAAPDATRVADGPEAAHPADTA